MAIEWKQNQLDVINQKDGEILVSASAGSGKTAVMIERLIRIIGDGVCVSDVLCLTFTKSAAKEIRDRLKASLLEKVENSQGADRARYERELDKLPFADVTTIDGFCNSIVSKYFEQAGVDPTVKVASSDEAKSLIYRSAEQVLTEYGEKEDDVYMELVDFLGKRRSEESVLSLIIKINEFLSTIANRDRFVEKVKEQSRAIQNSGTALLYELARAQRVLREIDALALECLKFDLPYPEDVLRYTHITKKAIEIGAQEFFSAVNENLPENPNYAKKIYKDKKEESYAQITALKSAVNKFHQEYGGENFLRVEKDAKGIARYSDKIFELVEALFNKYESALSARGLIDFAGIENKTRECLKDEQIRREIAGRYTHVLVDEYQDTNRLQDDIIACLKGGKSLFMVGDAKQSIYEFRHAEPEIFVEKKTKEGVKHYTLDKNFRSDECIINAVNRVFTSIYNLSSAGEDYKDQIMLGERKGEQSEIPPVSCTLFFGYKRSRSKDLESIYSVMESVPQIEEEEVSKEAVYLVEKIKEVLSKGLICDKKGETRQVTYRDIAIISRSRNERVKNILSHLKKCGIPLAITEKSTLSNSCELLVHLLKAIDNPLREDSLICAMLSPIFDFEERELAKYKLEMPPKTPFFEGLKTLKGKTRKLDDFLNKMEEYKFRSKYSQVHELLSFIIKDTRFEEKLLCQKDGARELVELGEFLTSLASSEIAVILSEYLNFFEQYPYFESERTTGDADAVKVMTMHASKGLEFPVVFIIDTGTAFNDSDLKQSVTLHKKYGVSLPTFDLNRRVWRENFFTKAIKRRLKEDIIAQELRLLYVAMTRARNMLFISGSTRATSPKNYEFKTNEKDATSMLEFILIAKNKDEKLDEYIRFEYEPLSKENEQEQINSAQDVEVDQSLIQKVKESINSRYLYSQSTLTPAKFTVTALSKDDEEGISFSLADGSSAEEGTLYHTVMQNIPLNATSKEDISLALDKMLLDEIITKDERNNLSVEIIHKVMNLDVMREISSMQFMREQAFLLRVKHSEIEQDGVEDEVLLQGVIDLLSVKGNEAIIVDYKYSGASESVLKERYKKQLALYKLALQKIMPDKKVRTYLVSLKSAKVIEFEE